MTLRLGLVGTGWIAGLHLEALARLGRTNLVGVTSRTMQGAAVVSARWGGQPFDELDRMLDEAKPDIAYVCVPPHRAVAIGERLLERGIPFLTEKPLAADDAHGPERLGAAIASTPLVVAVGYHLRALDILPEVRERLRAQPARLVVAQWLGGTPAPPWWRLVAQGGGQVVEQATHLFDLARHLLGEAEVVGAASTRSAKALTPNTDVVDATVSTLRFDRGAVGAFANTRRLQTNLVQIAFASDGLLTTMSKGELSQGDWHVSFEDDRSREDRHAHADPYEVQAAAFLDAVEAGAPDRVLCTYADALRTDRLTRAVVAATGTPG